MSIIEFDFHADTNKKNKEAFNDAIPIGNGHIGAMIYGSPLNDKLVLNENTVWLGKKNRKRYSKDYYSNYKKVQNLLLENKYKEAEELAKLGLMPNPKGEAIYSMAGYLNIRHKKETITNYKRILDMKKGIVTVSYDTPNNHIKRTYLASYKDDCIYIKYESLEDIEIILSLDREKIIDENKVINNSILLEAGFNKKDKLGICVSANSNSISTVGASLILSGKVIEIYISMATNLYKKHPLKYILKNNKKAKLNDIYNNHILDYQNLYLKNEFICDDLKLKQMYDFSRYLLISSSRNNLPANLQGLWNQDVFPSWDSKYTININLQMNYWNSLPANLFECTKPLFSLLKRMCKNGHKVAKELYKAKGFVAHHNTDIYGDCYLQDHYLPATVWPLGAAWLSLFIYEAYEYTQDINLLKKYAYILIEAAKFILDILILDNGEYILAPSLSPENSFYVCGEVIHVSKGCEMDSQIIRDLFNAVINISKVIKIEKNFVERVKNTQVNLPKTKIESDGTIKEWYHDFEEAEKGHRHISHLYGLFPSDQFETPILKKCALNTINKRLENGGGHTGWSKAWITLMYTRLNEGDKALESFREFILKSTSKVGLDLHPPFQIDGNFGIGRAILEMIVHSKMGTLELLPALPKEIKNLEMKGVCIKGGYIVDIFVKNNELDFVNIYSKTEGALDILYNNKIQNFKLKKGVNRITKQDFI